MRDPCNLIKIKERKIIVYDCFGIQNFHVVVKSPQLENTCSKFAYRPGSPSKREVFAF